MAGISSADDWLLDVENSTDAVNAASTPAHKQSDEKNANPFLRQANADQFTSQSNNDSDTSKSQSQANCSMVTTSIKEVCASIKWISACSCIGFEHESWYFPVTC
eukprot:m.87455 g.87455  ORF g.87455 m.87455 type:complete len:105 (-) comp16408_c1_seq1:39-353(-)